MTETQTKILILVGATILLIYILSTFKSNKPKEYKNESFASTDSKDNESIVSSVSSNSSALGDSNLDKMLSRETDMSGNKKVSYAEGNRDQTGGELADFWADASNLTAPSGEFAPMEENNGFAQVPASKKTKKDEDISEIWNSDNLSPKDKTNKFFDVPEPIVAKSSKLINTTRHVGVNTTGSSKRNASYDIRGNGIPNPKMKVGPWLNSSIDPDTMIPVWTQ